MADGRLRLISDEVRPASQTGIHSGIRTPFFAPFESLFWAKSFGFRHFGGLEARVGIDRLSR